MLLSFLFDAFLRARNNNTSGGRQISSKWGVRLTVLMSPSNMSNESSEPFDYSETTSQTVNQNNEKNNHVQRWLSDMTVAEMVGQMSQIDINLLLFDDDGMGGHKRLKPDIIQRFIGELGIGSVLNTVADQQWTARDYREAMIELNQVAKRYNRPPVIWGIDSVHGANYIRDATLTPQALNLAATWNVTYAEQAGRLAARDTRAAGIHWLFSPLLGLAVEPRWARVYETFGEDPVLVGAMAAAMTQGIQTVDRSGSIPSKAAACAKHFIGYSMPRTGHDRSPSWIPVRHLYQYFVPPWKKVLTGDAAAMTVMEDYTETDGVPMVANQEALNYLLRQRLGFSGVLVTDYAEILNLHSWHHTAATDEAAVVQALQEGSVDMSMIPFNVDSFSTGIANGIQTQQLSVERIKTSAERVLKLKQDLLMFEETITIVEPNLDLVGTDEKAVLPMVQDSLILAKNFNTMLPLDTSKPLKIHVTGPTANSLTRQSGGWTWQWQGSPKEEWFSVGSTVMDAFQTVKNWTITYDCGVDVDGKECLDPDEKAVDQSLINQFKHWAGITPTTSMALAIEAADVADITIICVGEDKYAEKLGDIRSLQLPIGQSALVKAIQQNTDTKIILVYFGGRPRLLSDMVDSVDAVILGFLPGPSAGQAVIDVVTGAVNPSGRLPITYPAADDGGGIPYWSAVTDQCTDSAFRYVPCTVQWPFGHGLSYTSFAYSELSAIGGIDTDLHVTVTVTNTGDRVGADTVMFFTFDESRQITPEYKRLRAFEKIVLSAGESFTVKMTIPVDDLRFIGHHDERHYVVDPHMVSYLGVGYMTDCRLRDQEHNPDDNASCVRLESQAPDKPYDAACEAACVLWEDSGCSKELGFDKDLDCLEMCTAINSSGPMSAVNDGWGWNYVNCLESVVWGLKERQHATYDCWMMTGICRDVFQTGQLSQYARGPVPSTKVDATKTASSCVIANDAGSLAHWLALAAGILASLFMFQLIRGKFTAEKRKQVSRDDEEEMFNGIQFSNIRNGLVD